MTGLRFFAFSTARYIRSDASPSPPPLSTRSTMAFTIGSSTASLSASMKLCAPAMKSPPKGDGVLRPPVMFPSTGMTAIAGRMPQAPVRVSNGR